MSARSAARGILGVALLLWCIAPLWAQPDLGNAERGNQEQEGKFAKGKYVIKLLIPGDPGTPENYRTAVGAFVAVNDDDDDADDVADNGDPTVANENDLVLVTILAMGGMPDTDSLVVRWDNEIDVYTKPGKSPELQLQSPASIPFEKFRAIDIPNTKVFEIYLEGDQVSELRDIEMTAVYDKEGTNWGDEIAITVMKVDVVATGLTGAVSEMKEEKPGAFVHWNLDNDDGSPNDVPATPVFSFGNPPTDVPKHPGADYAQDTQAITEEDDLLQVQLSLAPSADALASGTLTLRRSGAGVRV